MIKTEFIYLEVVYDKVFQFNIILLYIYQFVHSVLFIVFTIVFLIIVFCPHCGFDITVFCVEHQLKV